MRWVKSFKASPSANLAPWLSTRCLISSNHSKCNLTSVREIQYERTMSLPRNITTDSDYERLKESERPSAGVLDNEYRVEETMAIKPV